MTLKFHGSLGELKEKLRPLDLDGDWEELPNSVWKLKSRDGGGVLWSQTRGTLWFDGPNNAKDALSTKVETALGDGTEAVYVPSDSTIFVVHGSDHASRDQL